MPVSPKILKACGCTPADWKPLFTARGTWSQKEKNGKLPQIKRLELLISNRINDGGLKCLRDYRMFAAIDMAYDSAFDVTTPTLINNFLSEDWSKSKPEEILSKLNQWGLKSEDLFLQATNQRTGAVEWRWNVPTFYKTIIGLVKAYITIRRAKLFNDRNKVPLLDYEPIEWNAETRILCEILNYVMQVIAADYGYARQLDQVILQTLQYATCLMFPREVWHAEYQTESVDGEAKKVLQKEGIRYCTPHPTRMFWDLNYDISSLNTDSGCEYAGFWRVVPYGTILDNPNYWNRRAVGFASTDWFSPDLSSNFFTEVYPCQMAYPNLIYPEKTSREADAIFYATNQRDMAVFQTDLWMKLVPAKWKLGTYKYPIWVRFVVANDNSILYAEPACYSPVLFCGYDTDQMRSKNASMALEVLPTQDLISNTLSQILLTVKQNLINVHFYDKNVLNREDIDRLRNSGEVQYRSVNLVEYDSFKNARAGLDVKAGIIALKFDYKDITPLFQALSTQLSILERLLQLSAQESGAAGPHQQSKEEIKILTANTDTRVQFTGSFIDDFLDAWKRQQFEAHQAYADDEISAMIPSDIPDVEEHLEQLGFEQSGTVRGEGKLRITGSKKGLLKLDAFAVTGKGPQDKKNDTQTAQIMMQAMTAVANSQMLGPLVGPKALLKIIEKAAILAGADKDFKLRPDDKQQATALQQMAEEIMQACVKKVEADVSKPAADEIAKIQAEVVQLQQVVAKALKLKPPPPRNVPPQGAVPAASQPPQQPQPQPQPPLQAASTTEK